MSEQFFDGDEDDDLGEYAVYEDLFDPENPHPGKRPRQANHTPKKAREQIVAELADPLGLEGGFHTTYTPGRLEKQWLLSSLRPFYDEHLIDDVLAAVKGGKEASVYKCRTTDGGLVAAKVYRPREFRALRNDSVYKQGRATLTAEGRAVKATDDRILRALGKNTKFGQQVAHTSWLMYEFTTMQKLYAAGAAVPEPMASAENAILMGYIGDDDGAAPTLSAVALAPGEAAPLLAETLRNIELLLALGFVHGDLSAYNILYWDGQITLIDFPQVTAIASNDAACDILARDIARVCAYFARQGVPCHPESLTARLWRKYGQGV